MDIDTTSPILKPSLAEKIAEWSLLAVIFLTPLFFIPSSVVLFQFAKVIILFLGIIVCICASIIARLKDGNLWYTRNVLFLSLAIVPLVYAISALLSPSRSLSIMGAGFEVGSLVFIIAVTLFAFFISFLFSSKRQTLYSYLAFFVPIPLIALFQFIRLLAGPNVLSFGVLTSNTSTLLGGWNDLGIYFGAAALFTFITLELLHLDKWIKIAFISTLSISLFFLTIINFSVVWYILAAFALVFFVYNFSFNKSSAHEQSPVHTGNARRSVPIVSFVVIIVSVIFILVKGNIYSTLGADLFHIDFFKKFSVDNVEVRPSWTATFDIAKQSFKQDPLFGVGPNRFLNHWLTAKPDVINSTIFWGTDFNYGVGLIPTFFITTGIVGSLSWLVFFALFLYMGFKALFTKNEDTFLGYVSISSFVISLYLWIFAVIYVPSPALFVLTFFFTGIFMASLMQNGLVKTSRFNFIRDPRTSFASVMVFIILLIVVLISSYGIGRKFIASIVFNKGLVAANIKGDIATAEANIISAIRINEEDQYYRTLADLNLVKINILLGQKDLSQEILQNQFRADLASAQGAAQAAVNIDKTDYQNWLTLGRVYESVVPLNVEGAYESAQAAYTEARKLNPKSPAILLVIARLDVAHKDIAKAKTEIAEALKLKPDYTDAIYFLSQIQVNEGDIKSAIASTESAAYLNPTNSGIYFQLGLLRYDNKDYTGAASAFEQAIALTSDYANAKYFLGLSYAKLSKTAEAIKQFEDIAATNPDNAEVALILKNLKAGKDPFLNATPPVDSTPEKRSRLPVQEENQEADTADR